MYRQHIRHSLDVLLVQIVLRTSQELSFSLDLPLLYSGSHGLDGTKEATSLSVLRYPLMCTLQQMALLFISCLSLTACRSTLACTLSVSRHGVEHTAAIFFFIYCSALRLTARFVLTCLSLLAASMHDPLDCTCSSHSCTRALLP